MKLKPALSFYFCLRSSGSSTDVSYFFVGSKKSKRFQGTSACRLFLTLEIYEFFAHQKSNKYQGLADLRQQAREFIGFVEVLYEGQGISPARQVWPNSHETLWPVVLGCLMRG
jgi:hypothetical protein